MDLLFPNFEENEAIFRAYDKFLETMFVGLMAETGTFGRWYSWVARHHADGSPFCLSRGDFSGSPLLDRRCYFTDRALRVTPTEVFRDRPNLDAYIETYGSEDSRLWPREELCIALTATSESVKVARALLKHWMTPETTQESMDIFIDKQLQRFSEG